MRVARPRGEVMINALDHNSHFACSLDSWNGQFVHDGRMDSHSPGHRDRGGTDQGHSRPKARGMTLATLFHRAIIGKESDDG